MLYSSRPNVKFLKYNSVNFTKQNTVLDFHNISELITTVVAHYISDIQKSDIQINDMQVIHI